MDLTVSPLYDDDSNCQLGDTPQCFQESFSGDLTEPSDLHYADFDYASISFDTSFIQLTAPRYSREEYRDYYRKIGVLAPENPLDNDLYTGLQLNLEFVKPVLKLNGRDRGGNGGNAHALHGLRKICRALRAALGPDVERLWRGLELKFGDKQGNLSQGGCYKFLEAIIGPCPYVAGPTIAACTKWDGDQSNNDVAYLYPQAEELNHPGIACYMARLVSWATKTIVTPEKLNGCFIRGGNGYKTDDSKLEAVGAYMWNWTIRLDPLQIKASSALPCRVRLPTRE